MTISLVHSLDLQITGPAEHYSDFGDIAQPKIAAAWDIFEDLRIPSAYSEGFRAPNLEQVNDQKRTFRTSQLSQEPTH